MGFLLPPPLLLLLPLLPSVLLLPLPKLSLLTIFANGGGSSSTNEEDSTDEADLARWRGGKVDPPVKDVEEDKERVDARAVFSLEVALVLVGFGIEAGAVEADAAGLLFTRFPLTRLALTLLPMRPVPLPLPPLPPPPPPPPPPPLLLMTLSVV